MVLQLLPETAYYDLDELRSRHDIRLVLSDARATIKPLVSRHGAGVGAAGRVEVRIVTHDGLEAIDIERPASASSQHAVGVVLSNLRLDVARSSWQRTPSGGGVGSTESVDARVRLALPYHVRYPRPVKTAAEKGTWLEADGASGMGAAVPQPLLLYRVRGDGGEGTSEPGPWRLAALGASALRGNSVHLPFPHGEGWLASMATCATAGLQVLGLGGLLYSMRFYRPAGFG